MKPIVMEFLGEQCEFNLTGDRAWAAEQEVGPIIQGMKNRLNEIGVLKALVYYGLGGEKAGITKEDVGMLSPGEMLHVWGPAIEAFYNNEPFEVVQARRARMKERAEREIEAGLSNLLAATIEGATRGLVAPKDAAK